MTIPQNATCLHAGHGISVWLSKGLHTRRFYLRENGYVSNITEAHAIDAVRMNSAEAAERVRAYLETH